MNCLIFEINRIVVSKFNMGQSQNPPNRNYDGVHFFYSRIYMYHTKVTSEPHCIS